MKIKSPSDVVATACKRFFARIDKLFNEGLGPWIALIGARGRSMILALIYYKRAFVITPFVSPMATSWASSSKRKGKGKSLPRNAEPTFALIGHKQRLRKSRGVGIGNRGQI